METRKQREKEFHNILRDKRLISSEVLEYLTSNKKWYLITRKSRLFVEKWLINKCINKIVLDYCCGNGEMSFKIVNLGAEKVVGIDISDISIESANHKARKCGFDKRCEFFIMDAEKMDFGDNYFDIINISGVLHHLNLNKAYSELARVLKPNGEIICIEALGHNPIIHCYRKITPHLRTQWKIEHILRKKDIEMAKTYFNNIKILGFFHLFSLAAVSFRNTAVFNLLLSILEKMDNMLLTLPILKWQAWQVIFVLSQPKNKS